MCWKYTDSSSMSFYCLFTPSLSLAGLQFPCLFISVMRTRTLDCLWFGDSTWQPQASLDSLVVGPALLGTLASQLLDHPCVWGALEDPWGLRPLVRGRLRLTSPRCPERTAKEGRGLL